MIIIAIAKYALFIFAAWLCILNFYLSFLRYPLLSEKRETQGVL